MKENDCVDVLDYVILASIGRPKKSGILSTDSENRGQI